jgi:microcystin-dependent protein
MNGQHLSIAQNTALFSLLGTQYGGNGQTTFALPTAKPIFTATGAPLLQCIALEGIYPSRT